MQSLFLPYLYILLCLVEKGGWLFEYYLLSCSGYAVHELYSTYLSTADPATKSSLFDDIVIKCLPQFSGWLLFHINSIGTTGRKQMFYITFVNHYFGLSRSGIEMNNAIGYGVSLGMYDRERKSHEKLSLTRTNEVIQTGQFVEWWDNFSKFMGRSVPTIKKDIFASCLWTGITVNQYTGDPVDVKVRNDAHGKVIPAMPDDLFAHAGIVVDGIAHIFDQGKSYLDKSLVKKYDVLNVPLKVDTKRFPAEAATLNNAKNSTKHINPYKLLRHNIGSNLGLVTILREYQDDKKMTLHDTVHHYSTVNTDENIFARGLKVINDCCILFFSVWLL